MRKRSIVPVFCTILCMLSAMVAFSLSAPSSHAIGAVPARTLHISNVVHPSDVVVGNVYYGISGSFNSIYAMRSSSGKPAWQYTLQPGIFVDADSLHFVSGTVYFSASNTLYALDATSGALRWKSATFLNLQLWSTPESNGLVFAGVNDGVDTFNALNGNLSWHYTTNAPVSAGTVVNTTAYFITNNGTAFALNATSGTLLWQTSVGTVGSIATITNGIVYAAVHSTASNSDGTVYALTASTGTVLWRYAMPHVGSGGKVVLTVANNMVYVSENLGFSGFLFLALNAKNGVLLWPHQTGTTVVWYVISNNVVYTSSSTTVYARNAKDGSTLWSYKPGYTFEAFTVFNNTLYIAPDGTGNIVALNAGTGYKLWSYKSHDFLLSWYISATSDAFYVNGSSVALALNGKNGTLLWRYTNQYSTNTPPILVQNVEYITSSDSTAYALDAKTGTLLWAY